jgi:hypothetical protein
MRREIGHKRVPAPPDRIMGMILVISEQISRDRQYSQHRRSQLHALGVTHFCYLTSHKECYLVLKARQATALPGELGSEIEVEGGIRLHDVLQITTIISVFFDQD